MKQSEVSKKITSRKKKILIGILAVLILGAAYFVVIKLTGFYVPCIFRTVTGLKCPGCGISHMLGEVTDAIFNVGGQNATLTGGAQGAALSSSWQSSFFSNLMRAASNNYFLFFTFPFLIFEIVYALRCAWTGKKMSRLNNILLYIYLALLIVWAVVRNVVGV